MEFKEFCEGFNRMCRECRVEDNPFAESSDSDYAEDWLIWATDNYEEAEDYVATWVKENPAPIYPTFGEYLRDMACHDETSAKVPSHELLDMPIPRKVAEYYNIVPLNACGLTKYTSEWV